MRTFSCPSVRTVTSLAPLVSMHLLPIGSSQTDVSSQAKMLPNSYFFSSRSFLTNMIKLTIFSIESEGGRWEVVVVALKVKLYRRRNLSSYPRLERKFSHSGSSCAIFFASRTINRLETESRCSLLARTQSHTCSFTAR